MGSASTVSARPPSKEIILPPALIRALRLAPPTRSDPILWKRPEWETRRREDRKKLLALHQADPGSIRHTRLKKENVPLLGRVYRDFKNPLCSPLYAALLYAGLEPAQMKGMRRHPKAETLLKIAAYHLRGEDLSEVAVLSSPNPDLRAVHAAGKRIYKSWETTLARAGISYDSIRRRRRNHSDAQGAAKAAGIIDENEHRAKMMLAKSRTAQKEEMARNPALLLSLYRLQRAKIDKNVRRVHEEGEHNGIISMPWPELRVRMLFLFCQALLEMERLDSKMDLWTDIHERAYMGLQAANQTHFKELWRQNRTASR